LESAGSLKRPENAKGAVKDRKRLFTPGLGRVQRRKVSRAVGEKLAGFRLAWAWVGSRPNSYDQGVPPGTQANETGAAGLSLVQPAERELHQDLLRRNRLTDLQTAGVAKALDQAYGRARSAIEGQIQLAESGCGRDCHLTRCHLVHLLG
jgi:hypothetical protein